MGFEMAQEPVIEPHRKIASARLLVSIEFVEKGPDVVEQSLVILSMLRQRIVAALSHVALFPNEMLRDCVDQSPEYRRICLGLLLHHQLIV